MWISYVLDILKSSPVCVSVGRLATDACFSHKN